MPWRARGAQCPAHGVPARASGGRCSDRGRPWSAQLPYRLALFLEGARAFGPVLALRGLLVELARVGHERRRECGGEAIQAHGGLYRQRRACADHRGEFLRGGHELRLRHHLVDDRLRIALLRGEPSVAQREIRGGGARQRGVEVVAGAQAADLGVRVADPRGVGHHAQLALQCEREPDADGKPVDRGDQRLFEVRVGRRAAAAPVEQRIVGILVRRADALGLVFGEELDVATCAERLVTSAGEDADVDVRIEPDVAPAGAQLRVGVRVQRIHDLRAVDRHVGDVSLLLVAHVLEVAGHRARVIGRFVAGHGACSMKGKGDARASLDDEEAVHRGRGVAPELQRIHLEREARPGCGRDQRGKIRDEAGGELALPHGEIGREPPQRAQLPDEVEGAIGGDRRAREHHVVDELRCAAADADADDHAELRVAQRRDEELAVAVEHVLHPHAVEWREKLRRPRPEAALDGRRRGLAVDVERDQPDGGAVRDRRRQCLHGHREAHLDRRALCVLCGRGAAAGRHGQASGRQQRGHAVLRQHPRRGTRTGVRLPGEGRGRWQAPQPRAQGGRMVDHVPQGAHRAAMLIEHVETARRERLGRAGGHRLPGQEQRLARADAGAVDELDDRRRELVEAGSQEQPRVGLGQLRERVECRRHVGAMLRCGHHAGREVDRIGDGGQRRDQRRERGLRLRRQGRHRESRALALVGAHDAAAAAEGGDQHAIARRQLVATQRREREADVEQLFGGVDADHREFAADRVERAVAAGQPSGVRQRRAAGRFGDATLQHDDRLASRVRGGERAHERVGIGEAFRVYGDHSRAVVRDQRVHEVRDAEHRLVADARRHPEAEAEGLRPRVRHHREAAALAHHRQRAGRERRVVDQHRRERRGHAQRRVDHADAVGTAQQEAARPGHGGELALARGAVRAHFREPARPHDGTRHAGVRARGDDLDDAVGGHRHDREVGHGRQRPHAGEAGQAADGGARRVDRPHRAAVAELLQEADGATAEIALPIGRADHRDRARRDERRQGAERGIRRHRHAPVLQLDLRVVDELRPFLGLAHQRRTVLRGGARLGIDALRDQRLAHGGIGNGLGQRVAQDRHPVGRHAGRGDESPCAGDVERRQAHFGERRHVRQRGRAFRPRDGQRAQLAGLDERHRGDVVHRRLHAAADEVGHGRSAALVGHVHEVDPRGAQPQLHCEVRCAAHAGGGEIELAGLGLRELDEGGVVLGRHVVVHHQDVPVETQRADRREAFHRVVLEARVQAPARGMGDRVDQQHRVAVGRCPRDELGADRAAGARMVLHDERLAEDLAHALGQDAPEHVGGPARRERHDELHEVVGKGLGAGAAGGDGEAEQQCAGPRSERSHVGLLLTLSPWVGEARVRDCARVARGRLNQFKRSGKLP